MNSLTDWLDLSSTYGSTDKEFEELIDPSARHRLLVSKRRGQEPLLPRCEEHHEEHHDEIEICAGCEELDPPVEGCFFAGDVRVNEQPGLTVMHTLWVREHNR